MTSPCDNEEKPPYLTVRRLHNYVYCPRLFYLQWVENIFVPNEDTVTGSAIHSRVDEPTKIKQDSILSEGGNLRSVYLSSDTLELTGVADLVESLSDGKRFLIDYKKGSPNRTIHGEWQVKDNDAIQLGAYALLLKENGVDVDSAGIYYAEIKKRVYVDLTPQLFKRVERCISEAKSLAASHVCPPPVCDARCLYCSAYPVCLPFESRMWANGTRINENCENPPRAPMAEHDDGEFLVVQSKDAFVGTHGGELVVKVNSETVSKHPVHQLAGVCLYGPIQISAQAQHLLLEHGVSLSWFSPAGRFIGMANALPSSGVDARMGQYQLWASPEKRLALAARIIKAKIHNQRVLLMRNGDAGGEVLRKMAALRDSCDEQTSLHSLRGIEGAAAALYFENFGSMIKSALDFDFNGRNRRPPKDEINSLLSMGYSVLVKELSGVAYTVGMDPFLGFFHSPRYGRPALALDMMEEFRPLIVDSTVISLVNRGEVSPSDFSKTTHGVLLGDSARRQFWRAWTRRMDTEITHPEFGYKMSYRRMLYVQMRQLWRFCRGDIQQYHAFTTR